MADRQEDRHYQVCKVCGVSKKRIRAGKYGARTPKWLGEDGLLWNGLVCGECHRKQVSVRQSIKKFLKNDAS